MASPTTPSEPLTTEALYNARLQARQEAGPTFDPHEVRLSEAGLCGRKQSLRALGATAEGTDLEQESIFNTGHEQEDLVLSYWRQQFPRRVRTQVPVTTPWGTGHIDIWVPPLGKLVECKTTTRKMLEGEKLPIPHHVDQVNLYLHWWGKERGVTTAEIAYRIKETGRIKSFPVVYDQGRAQELSQDLAILARVIQRGEVMPIPTEYGPFSFPCFWGTARCAYWKHCWGGAQVIPGADVVTVYAPQLVDAIARYKTLRERRKAVSDQDATLKEEQKAIEAGFASVMDTDQAMLLQVGDVELKRWIRSAADTFDWEQMLDDGTLSAETLDTYRKEGTKSFQYGMPKPIKRKKGTQHA